MSFFKKVENGYIIAIGTGLGGAEITEEEYREIDTLERPSKDGYGYRLLENLTWEEYELPPSEEPDTYTEEALLGMTNGELQEILTGLGVSATMNKVNMVRLILLMQGEVIEE